jgi:glycosyltransferase involved in cell wall biosynthesis
VAEKGAPVDTGKAANMDGAKSTIFPEPGDCVSSNSAPGVIHLTMRTSAGSDTLSRVGHTETDPTVHARSRSVQGLTKLSVCIPVYNGADTIAPLVVEVGQVLGDSGFSLEIVLVNDGSTDNSHEVCTRLAAQYPGVIYIALRKNAGEHNAVMCALNYCTGDYAAIIDDDFQNPPSEIIKLLDVATRGYDVVYSKYHTKKHHVLRNMGSAFNDIFATWLLRKPRHLYLSSFKVINRPLINEIIKYKGPFPYVDGLVLRATDSITSVFVDHSARAQGKSNYTLGRLFALWMNMFINFSIRPLRVISLIGLGTSAISFLLGVLFLIDRIGNQNTPPGWATTILLILFLGGVQTFSIGVIGEYIGKNYLDRNGTPQWTVREIKRSPEG